MEIYGIADLHLDITMDKPMDVFGKKWVNHEENIFNNWGNTVGENDLILIPGDISWALKLEDAKKDLERIDYMPGIKVLSKGNHDYWWSTKAKLNNLQLKTLNFISNDSYIYKDIAICGTRGWMPKDSDDFKVKDEKIFERELNRLKLSLQSINKEVNKKIVMLHYPPFNVDKTPNEFVDVMNEYGVDICVYGHLHAEGHRLIVEGNIKGIEFHCISCDFINFNLKKIL